MNDIKIFNYKNDKRYSLVYHTDTNIYSKWYWYDHLKNILSNFNCIIINSIEIPIEDHHIAVNFLKEFCDIMTAGNRVIIFDTEELLNINNEKYIFYIENILCKCNFINIPANTIEVYDTFVYINTNGTRLLNMVDELYGIYYD